MFLKERQRGREMREKMVGRKGEDEEGEGEGTKLLQPDRTIVNSVTL